MVRMDYQVELQYDVQSQSEFVFNVCPARTRSQRVLNETLEVEGATPSYTFTDPVTANRINRLYSEGGPLSIRYRVTIELDHVIDDPDTIGERAIRTMPSDVIPYILPSRLYFHVASPAPAMQPIPQSPVPIPGPWAVRPSPNGVHMAQVA